MTVAVARHVYDDDAPPTDLCTHDTHIGEIAPMNCTDTCPGTPFVTKGDRILAFTDYVRLFGSLPAFPPPVCVFLSFPLSRSQNLSGHPWRRADGHP